MLNQLKSFALLTLLTPPLIGVGMWLGSGWLLAAVALAIAFNLACYFLADRIVLWCMAQRNWIQIFIQMCCSDRRVGQAS